MTPRVAVRQRELEWRQVGDEVVVLDLRTQRYLSLNPAGASLWPLLTAGTSRQRLVDELVGRFGIDAAVASRDVEALLGQLTGTGLLEDDQEDGGS